IAGTMAARSALGRGLAGFRAYESAPLFGSGSPATSGVIAALAQRDETVFSDELNHASIIDGCRLARAETFVYRHADLDHLAWGLRRAGGRGAPVGSDGVFSMGGPGAPPSAPPPAPRRHGRRPDVDAAPPPGAP